MKNIKIMQLLFVINVFTINYCKAANVDTVEVYSDLMKKNIKCVIVKPNNYKKSKTSFPVVYLLHGFSGSYNNWIKKVPAIEKYANDYQLVIVCPDGGYSSWYLDSPIDPTYQYETFVSGELVNFIDNNYKTVKNPKGRALTGLSMGGHGGIYVGLKHPQTFGAIGSMSGALDVTLIRNRYQVEKRLGDSTTYNTTWKNYSSFAMIDTLAPTNQKIIIDCGTEDFVLQFSESLHKQLLKRKFNHDYVLRPGTHDWKYWGTAVDFQLLFFKRFFEEK